MFNLIDTIKDYKAVFVDVDNTLFNYTYSHNKALTAVLKKYNLSMDDYNKAKRVIKIRDLQSNSHKKELYFKIMCEQNNLSLQDTFDMYTMYSDIFNVSIKPDNSMFNLLKEAKIQGKKVIAITNYYVIPQIRKLKSSGFLEFIDDMVTSEEFEVEKPNTQLLNRALELANCKVDEAIMFGDSIVDNMSSLGLAYYPYNCSKLLISISGKSGAGKTTISKIIKDVFEAEVIEGDGYHKYQRNHPEWKNVTHYNPDANNLVQLSLDIKNIYHDLENISVPIYNHNNGLFDEPKQMKNTDLDVVIIEGLHTLYPEVTGDYVKLKIYLDNNNADQQKIDRDTKKRSKTLEGVKSSIEERESDYAKYIDIQKKFSNFLIEVKDETFTITIKDDLIPGGSTISGEYKDLNETLNDIMIQFKEKRYKD